MNQLKLNADLFNAVINKEEESKMMRYFKREAKGKKIYKCKLCNCITTTPDLHLIMFHFYTKDELEELQQEEGEID